LETRQQAMNEKNLAINKEVRGRKIESGRESSRNKKRKKS